MSALLSLSLLALPTLLVCAAIFFWRDHTQKMRLAIWLTIGTAWAISGWFWVSYSRQQDDVGLMVDGILAGATAIAALIATLAATVLLLRR